MDITKDRIFVSGASGYVGGRLVARLLADGWQVRAVGRSIEKLRSRSWAAHPALELAALNMLDESALARALRGCSAAYYLVHSMNPDQKDFAEADIIIAGNMARAAGLAGVSRIIYLGGLGEKGENLSRHLLSRARVAEVLRQGSAAVTVLRAAMIIGSGSASFEMLRYLADRLPVMLTPRWLSTPCEPVAIRNVITYLAGCLDHDETSGQTFDIGGGEVVTYRQLVDIYTEEAGLRPRLIIQLPFLTLHLSALWIHLLTPIPASLAGPLLEGLRNPVVCYDKRLRDIIPQELLTPRQAVRLAFEKYPGHLESHWSDAGELPPVEWSRDGDPLWAGGMVYRDSRTFIVRAPARHVWSLVSRIGGAAGWYHATWLWKLRGAVDRMCAGPGFRMGRRDPVDVQPGDALDFWRVAAVKPGELLCLAAEMRLPGRAFLEFRILPQGGDQSVLQQTAYFRPKGLGGILYWFAVTPFHAYIFGGMGRSITLLAERSFRRERGL